MFLVVPVSKRYCTYQGSVFLILKNCDNSPLIVQSKEAKVIKTSLYTTESGLSLSATKFLKL